MAARVRTMEMRMKIVLITRRKFTGVTSELVMCNAAK